MTSPPKTGMFMNKHWKYFMSN